MIYNTIHTILCDIVYNRFKTLVIATSVRASPQKHADITAFRVAVCAAQH